MKKTLDGLIDNLVLEVPYRFLSPWIHQPTRNYAKVRVDSRQLKNNCLYSIEGLGREKFIVLNPQWNDFIRTNFNILEQFGYWNLLQFLHSQNMNDPSILKKIKKPIEKRKELRKHREIWNQIFLAYGVQHCIYSNEELNTFDLDHFLPWRYMHHNQLWNLVPVLPSINQFYKRDKLPDLELYLKPFVEQQRKLLCAYADGVITQHREIILEDYGNLGVSPNDLLKKDNADLYLFFHNYFAAWHMSAHIRGFSIWKL